MSDSSGSRRPGVAAPVMSSAAEAYAAASAYAERVRPGSGARDRSGALPRDELADLDSTGLLAISIPEGDGGLGAPPGVVAEVVRRIAVADPALAQALQGHFAAVDLLVALAEDGARREVFEEVRAGGRISASFAERGGAHAQDLVTRVSRSAEPRVSGRKFYCTGALTARIVGVSGRDDDDRLVVALLDRDAPGLELDEDWTAMGQRATVSGSARMEDVPVAADRVLPLWRLFEGPQLFGARAQLIHAAIEAGIARAALDDTCGFLATRARPFFEAARAGVAERAVDDPHTLGGLGRLTTRVRAAEQLLAWAGDELAAPGITPEDPAAAAAGSIAVAQAKAFASEVAVEAASQLFTLCGASATDERWNLDRHWRNSRTHSVHDPVAWKYHHVGAYQVDGRPPPNHGQI